MAKVQVVAARKVAPGPQGIELPALPKMAALPAVPDIGSMTEGEKQVRDMLQGLFVDDISSVTEQQGALSAAGEGGMSLSRAFKQEAAAQDEFQKWMAGIKRAAAAAEGREEKEEEREPDVGELFQYLEAATSELSRFKAMAALLTEEDDAGAGGTGEGATLGDLNGGEEGDELEEEEIDEEVMMAQLKDLDPELYQLLLDAPGSKEDEDLLRFFSPKSQGGGGTEEEEESITDAEIKEFLEGKDMVDDDDASGLFGDPDEGDEDSLEEEGGGGEGLEEGDDGGMADLFDAIEEDEDLDEVGKMKAAYALQGIFNPAAEEEDPKKKKKREVDAANYDPSMRGMTTTGGNAEKGGGADVWGDGEASPPPPPLMLTRPTRTPSDSTDSSSSSSSSKGRRGKRAAPL